MLKVNLVGLEVNEKDWTTFKKRLEASGKSLNDYMSWVIKDAIENALYHDHRLLVEAP